jgi:hypothetical protein
MVFGNARVYDKARVYGDAWVYYKAKVYGEARVFGNCKLSGGDWKDSPFYEEGTMWPCYMTSKSHFAIGCESHTFEEWRKIQSELEIKNNMTEKQCLEYRAYLDLAERIYNNVL